jgi:tetraacyldisaccharide 4'-kinase
MWVSDYLNNKKLKAAVLTRGYKGKLEKSSGIIFGSEVFKNNPFYYGDEPLLLARKLPLGAVVIGKNRARNFLYYFNKIKPDVIVLDDGYQHLQIQRSMNIVMFDALLPSRSYKVAPLGYLREGPSSLIDADIAVISRSDQADDLKLNKLESYIRSYSKKDLPIAHIKFKPTGIYDSSHNKVYDMEELNGKKVFAFAALASPDSFFAILQKYSGELIDQVVFPDHYYFKASQINKIILESIKYDSILITSEKDIAKVKKVAPEARVFYLGVEVDFVKGEESLVNLMDDILRVK